MALLSFSTGGLSQPAKIIKQFFICLHPDKCTAADYRIQYVYVALTAFPTRSQQLVRGEQPTSDLCPLPRAFLTPFLPNGCKSPSALELEATQLAARSNPENMHAQNLE
eukprot:9247192-Ditylum_brightwellii.AAC.1